MNANSWNPELARRLDELAAAVIDSRVTPAEQEELARMLTEHAEARDAFLEQLDVEAMLRAREYRTGQASFAASSGPATVPITKPPSWRILGLAASLLVMTVMGLNLLFRPDPPAGPASVASIVAPEAGESPEWSSESPGLLASGQIGLGKLSLVRGTARLTTASEVELTLTAPCTLEFTNPRTVKVHEGRLKARVHGETAIGFRVLTPTADVVDLGTEFGVVVEQDGSSEVHVFHGVVVARALGNEQVVPIYRNEAGRVAAEQRVARTAEPMNVYRPGALVAVTARPDLFGQTAVEPPVAVRAPASSPLPREARVLFIGDPYIDSDVPLQLVEQAWADAGWTPAPKLFNGFVPDWIHQYAKRLEHHVLRFRPTHVVISFGPQYAWTPADRITPEKFREDLTVLVEQLTSRGIEPILATPYRFRAEHAEAQQILDGYNDATRALAKQKGLRLADIDQKFRETEDPLDPIVDVRGHLTGFAGYRLAAQALVEAFGQRDLAVPVRLELSMLPGVVQDWQFHLLPRDREALSPARATELKPAEDWQKLHLPQVDRFTPRLAEPSHSSLCRERAEGYGTHLTTGTHPIWQGISTVESPAARSAWLHVGGGTSQVWLNGELVFDNNWTFPAGHGHHAGYETVAVKLRAGENRVVLECSGAFFVSVNDSQDPPRRVLRP